MGERKNLRKKLDGASGARSRLALRRVREFSAWSWLAACLGKASWKSSAMAWRMSAITSRTRWERRRTRRALPRPSSRTSSEYHDWAIGVSCTERRTRLPAVEEFVQVDTL